MWRYGLGLWCSSLCFLLFSGLGCSSGPSSSNANAVGFDSAPSAGPDAALGGTDANDAETVFTDGGSFDVATTDSGPNDFGLADGGMGDATQRDATGSAPLPLDLEHLDLVPAPVSSMGWPTTFTTGDFDEDGVDDLLVASGGGIGVAAGTTGSVPFGAVRLDPAFAASIGYRYVVAIDLDRDGHLDLVTNGGVFGGPQTAGFRPISAPWRGSSAYGPDEFVVGDFDGDGNLDIVAKETVPRVPQGSLRLFRGDGRLGFGQGEDVRPSREVRGGPGLVYGDFDGDGDLDIVDSDEILWNNGQGMFGIPGSNEVVSKVLVFRGSSVPDFDHDGSADIVRLQDATTADYTICTVHFSRTHQRLEICGGRVAHRPPGAEYGVAIALDFNSDSKLDLVWEDDWPSLVFLSGNGNGALGDPAATAATATRIPLEDGFSRFSQRFVGLAAANLANRLVVIVGSATGLAVVEARADQSTPHLVSNFDHEDAIAVGDLDGDGFPDVTSGVATLEGTRGGLNWNTGAPLVSHLSVSGIALGDIDGDRVVDAVVTSRQALSVVSVFGMGSGRFSSPVTIANDGWLRPVLVDATRDGIVDFLSFNPTTNSLSESIGVGLGVFAAPLSIPLGGATDVAIGDTDGDGVLDLIAANSTNGITIAQGTTGGRFAASRAVSGFQPSYALCVGDLNRDGIEDTVALGFDGGSADPGTMEVFLSNSAGFRGAVSAAGPKASACEIADLNLDGYLDLVVSVETGFSVFRGLPEGRLDIPLSILSPLPPSAAVIKDLSGDGRPDIVWVSHGGNELHVVRSVR